MPTPANPIPSPRDFVLGRNIVISRQVPPLHPTPVVHDRQRRLGSARLKTDACCAGIERVGGDLGEDGLFKLARVSVTEVFEQVLKIDTCFAHSAL